MRCPRHPSRHGATLVEFAIVGPVTFMLLIGLMVAGMGIFRYQEVAHMAREASRYASVHGSQYASDTGNTAAAPDDGKWSGGTGKCSLVNTNVITPQATC